MITFEWKIEWHDRADLASGDIIDTDHFETLRELLDSAEADGRPCQVCLVRYDDKTNTRSHLYFAERGRYDEDGRMAPLKIASKIARNMKRIHSLMVAGVIITDPLGPSTRASQRRAGGAS